MKYTKTQITALSIMVISLIVGCKAYTKAESTITSTETKETYELTVPASKLLLSIPKKGLRKNIVKEMPSYRYFQFVNDKDNFIISGWFEPDTIYPGINKLWEDSVISWNNAGLSTPQKVSFSRNGIWDVVAYDMNNNHCIQPNLRAHTVSSGTWIELHLSFDCYSYSNRQGLFYFIKSIRVRTKT